MASDHNDEAFRKELLELFALEAQEWLEQAKKALMELQRQPDAAPNSKHLAVIQQGMSNLGGSAATVELPAVEQLAYGILPILDSIRSHGTPASAQQCGTIQERLDQIGGAIRELSGSSSPGTTGDPAHPQAAATGRSPSTADPKKISINVLKQVEQDLGHSSQAGRNLVALVLQKAGVNNEKGSAQISGSAITRILRELEGMDEQFLADVQRWMPQITEDFSKLKTEQGPGSPAKKTVDSLMKSVQELQEAARHVNATNVIQFSRGLHSFLTVMANRGPSLVNGRLQAVEFRLGAVVPMVQQWVEMGRIERTAIGKVLFS